MLKCFLQVFTNGSVIINYDQINSNVFLIRIRYPPYKEENLSWLRFLIGKSLKQNGVALMALGILCALLLKVTISLSYP